MESTNDNRGNWRVTVVLCVVTAAITAIVTVSIERTFDRFFPPRIVADAIATQHLKPLRSDYAPFVYTWEYDIYSPSFRLGLFGLFRKVPPAWFYTIQCANLTEVDVDRLDVRIDLPLSVPFVMVRTHSAAIYNKPEDVNQKRGEWLFSEHKAGGLAFTLAGLKSGRSIQIALGVVADTKPVRSDIALTLTCAEGQFQEISPLRYKAIGWKKVPGEQPPRGSGPHLVNRELTWRRL